jgi:hypothetical protein
MHIRVTHQIQLHVANLNVGEVHMLAYRLNILAMATNKKKVRHEEILYLIFFLKKGGKLCKTGKHECGNRIKEIDA